MVNKILDWIKKLFLSVKITRFQWEEIPIQIFFPPEGKVHHTFVYSIEGGKSYRGCWAITNLRNAVVRARIDWSPNSEIDATQIKLQSYRQPHRSAYGSCSNQKGKIFVEGISPQYARTAYLTIEILEQSGGIVSVTAERAWFWKRLNLIDRTLNRIPARIWDMIQALFVGVSVGLALFLFQIPNCGASPSENPESSRFLDQIIEMIYYIIALLIEILTQ